MRSMTGYAKINYQDENFSLNMQIKSVNNKNLNLKIKLPYSLNFLEGIIRTKVAEYVSRGSIDLKIDFSDLREDSNTFSYDKNESRAYIKVLKSMEEEFNEKFTNKLDILVRNLNVIQKNDDSIDEKLYKDFILEKLDELMKPFIKTKFDEGERLKFYLLERVDVLESKVSKIKDFKEMVVADYREKLLERLNSIKSEIDFDEKDILKEILLFTDKSDVSEEISRLDSHLLELRKDINTKKSSIGKKIDFILQEIFRELNTLGVKSHLYDMSKLVVEAKNELEKIREQVMNIE